MNQQPYEEMHRGAPKQGFSKELLSLWNLGPGMVARGSLLVHQPEALRTPFWALMEASLHRHD